MYVNITLTNYKFQFYRNKYLFKKMNILKYYLNYKKY